MLGSVFALSSAVFWAVAVILFKKAGHIFSPLSLNIYKSIVALILVSAAMAMLNIPFFPEVPLNTWLVLAASGILGITLADLCFFTALNRLGAGFVAVLECLYLPSVLFFSFLLLGERMGPGDMAGSTLVLAAILVGAWPDNDFDRGKSKLREPGYTWGIIAGLLSMVFMGLGIVMIKEVLEATSLFWATFVRVLAGGLGLAIIMAFHPGRIGFFRELGDSRAWFTALPASISGNFIALLCWVGGMKYTTASQAGTLNQMSTIFIFILAAVWLKERITRKKLAAICLAVVGAYLTIFF